MLQYSRVQHQGSNSLGSITHPGMQMDQYQQYPQAQQGFQMTYYNMPNFPHNENNYNQKKQFNNKSSKPPNGSKSNKQNGTSVRAGDWVCLLCNNLNFSFRNECNRCQMQTKKQNYMQLWQIQMMQENGIYDQQKQFMNKKGQMGLFDQQQMQQSSTFVQMSAGEGQVVCQQQPPQFMQPMPTQHMKKLKRKPPMNEFSQESPQFVRESPSSGLNDINTTPCPSNIDQQDKISKDQGFQNRLLLQHTQSQEDTTDHPYSSPEKLPSVSPILHNYKDFQLQENIVENNLTQKQEDEASKEQAKKGVISRKLIEKNNIIQYVQNNEDCPSPVFGGFQENDGAANKRKILQNQSDNEIQKSLKNLNLDEWDKEGEDSQTCFGFIKTNINSKLQRQRSQSLDDMSLYSLKAQDGNVNSNGVLTIQKNEITDCEQAKINSINQQ